MARWEPLTGRRLICVSDAGEPRATAYTMTSLFFRHAGRLHLSWMDRPLADCLGVLDADGRGVSKACVLGRPTDDHGNAAVVRDHRDRIHAIVGAHHGTFAHCIAEDPSRLNAWHSAGAVGERATHPSFVCDCVGQLHLAYRSSAANPWLLCYQRYGLHGQWSPALPLVRAAKPWYVTWTNSLAVAPDNTLHLVLAVAKPSAGGDGTYYGAAHLYSEDGGQTWRQYGGELLPMPAAAADLATIEDPAEAPQRVVPASEAAAFPGTPNEKAPVTLQMLLSNAAVDADGRPWVVVHNNWAKTAGLYCAEAGRWAMKADLSSVVGRALPGWVIAEQSAMSRHGDGSLEVVLPVVPLNGRRPQSFVGWQTDELELFRVRLDAEGNVRGAGLVLPVDPRRAAWLPNLETWDWNWPVDRPALLFTVGGNRASSPASVWLDVDANDAALAPRGGV